ncbi:MAG: hypothetical protein AseanaTS_25010 [Candidatus Pelagadaptatus aseana]|uniref:SDR family NAD(P)-dependent oxidoreductase n=1 Tax=Candidatus Pelagadaptatus aseana TaxID=3120508 RepID=UPI0039B134DD
MTTLSETIQINRPAHEVFTYVADFSNCQEWDSTAIAATRLNPGPVAVGSRFDVICAAPVSNIHLEYEIIELETDRKVVLVGRGRFFDVTDTITITPNQDGCELNYTAIFKWQPWVDKIAPLMQKRLEHMGYESIQIGLKQALDDNFQPPEISASNSRADRFLPLALSRFTKRGYRLGRKHWHPVSAYMGNKHVILTGATSGLGKSCAETLARLGAELTLVVRSQTKGLALRKSLIATTGNDNIHLEIADLSLMQDVEQVISNLNQRNQPIDVLINNAGALFNPRQQTSEGLEQSFALLLLGPYRLTEGLYPLLKQAASAGEEARVINVVSGGMYSQKLRVDDLQSEKDEQYSGSVAYARCKRALMIKTEQWAEDWADDGIVVNAMHPGWADTPGVETALPEFHKITRYMLRTPEEGADTINWLAVATEAGKVSGKLFLDREPRTTHLMKSTQESAEAREALREILSQWPAPQSDLKDAG